MDLAISGNHGVILHNLRSHKWRVFGDIRQEKNISCRALMWFGKIIIICNEKSSGAFELLLYPRFHLDETSLLLRKSLPEPPLALDASGDFILMATPPMELTMYRIDIQGMRAVSADGERIGLDMNIDVIEAFMSTPTRMMVALLLPDKECACTRVMATDMKIVRQQESYHRRRCQC